MCGRSFVAFTFTVWLSGAVAFLSTTHKSFRRGIGSVQLRPDGFLEGDRFDRMRPGYQEYYNVDEMNINPDEGGPLARVGLTEDRMGMTGNPMVRMDPSAPRMQRGPRSVVQGSGSRATWVSPRPFDTDEMNVHLGTQGRPLHANVEHWQSPGYSPSRMNLYSEDGGQRPWITKFRTPTNRDSGVTQVRNTGPMEFPIDAGISATNSPRRRAELEGTGGADYSVDPMLGSNMTPPKTIDGGALKTFGFDHHVQHVYVEVSSDGLPGT
jgi:hypothetical protein